MSDFETMRFGLRTAVAAIAFGAVGSVNAAVVFSDVAASSGLQFTSEDGTAFDFSGLPDPDEAIEMDIIQRSMGNGAAVGDYDNDGDLDVYMLAGLGVPNALFRNDLEETGVLQFTDVTATAGLANTGLSRVAQFTDLDNDGLLDLILLNDSDVGGLHPRSVIYRNDGGGVFTAVTAGSGFEPVGYIKGGLGVVDYDEDGLLDIYVTHWTEWGGSYLPGTDYNRLYRNLGEFQFEDVTEAAGLGVLKLDCFTPIFADFDNDGDKDLYVAIDGYPDRFYRQDDGVFVLAPEVGLSHVGTDMGAAAIDFDHDGDLDIYSTNITGPDNVYFGGNALMVNQLVETGTLLFLDQAQARGVDSTGWGWGTEWVDVDNSGSYELFAVNGMDEFMPYWYPPVVYEPLVNLRCFLFEEVTPGTGIYAEVEQSGADFSGDSRSTVAFDADRDGLQDLLVTNVNSDVVLLRNLSTPAGHWITVKLVGGGPISLDAVGARVFITVGTDVKMQELMGGGSYLAGRPYELHFGLGAAETIDELRVVWPNGEEDVVLDVPADQVFVVEYTDTTCPADFDGDDAVGFSDLTSLLSAWGPCGEGCLQDLDGDNAVGFPDLTALLANWGPC